MAAVCYKGELHDIINTVGRIYYAFSARVKTDAACWCPLLAHKLAMAVPHLWIYYNIYTTHLRQMWYRRNTSCGTLRRFNGFFFCVNSTNSCSNYCKFINIYNFFLRLDLIFILLSKWHFSLQNISLCVGTKSKVGIYIIGIQIHSP